LEKAADGLRRLLAAERGTDDDFRYIFNLHEEKTHNENDKIDNAMNIIYSITMFTLRMLVYVRLKLIW